MALWTINDIDISSVYGVVLKKGAYNNLFSYPSTKDYLTESTRETDGETAVIYNPVFEPRDVTLPMYIHAEDIDSFWAQYNAFKAFLCKQPINLSIEKHNRIYRLYYKSCSAFTNKRKVYDGEMYVECSFVFRETNPARVLEKTTLAQETGENLLTEAGEDIEILSRIE